MVKMGGTERGMVGAFITSAVLFAVVHTVHMIFTDPVVVAGDLVFALSGGMFLGAIYLRTKTLVAPILLHWLLNLAAGIFAAFTGPGYTSAGTPLDNLMTSAVVALPLIIAAFVMLRKVKPGETWDRRAAGVARDVGAAGDVGERGELP